mmetsp:Transcript_40795/g.121935  ORF Transcript_40795/g.121935 Transcript_40795/m.121935 type:complete len:216 (-) Transcript_40795:382-1029(-)
MCSSKLSGFRRSLTAAAGGPFALAPALVPGAFANAPAAAAAGTALARDLGTGGGGTTVAELGRRMDSGSAFRPAADFGGEARAGDAVATASLEPGGGSNSGTATGEGALAAASAFSVAAAGSPAASGPAAVLSTGTSSGPGLRPAGASVDGLAAVPLASGGSSDASALALALATPLALALAPALTIGLMRATFRKASLSNQFLTWSCEVAPSNMP